MLQGNSYTADFAGQALELFPTLVCKRHFGAVFFVLCIMRRVAIIKVAERKKSNRQ